MAMLDSLKFHSRQQSNFELPTRFAAVMILTSLMVRPVFADSYCGAGRHVGAENDGAGQSWLCIPDAARSSQQVYVPGGGGSVSAGLGAAAAGLGGLADLLSIVSELGSNISATDANGSVPDRDAEKAAAAVSSRDLNRQAIAALQAGRFDLAADLFNRAAAEAVNADNREEAEANWNNAKIASAEDMLRLGYSWEQKGDLATASQYYIRGKQAAENAQASDLAAKLAAYNDNLVARAGGTNSGVKATQSSCTRINDQVLCR